jgi:hypothetical protein
VGEPVIAYGLAIPTGSTDVSYAQLFLVNELPRQQCPAKPDGAQVADDDEGSSTPLTSDKQQQYREAVEEEHSQQPEPERQA